MLKGLDVVLVNVLIKSSVARRAFNGGNTGGRTREGTALSDGMGKAEYKGRENTKGYKGRSDGNIPNVTLCLQFLHV